jgi:hypothetical protein
MLYQLPNGKVINISIETYLRMSDDDLRFLNESNYGGSYVGDNPFEVEEEVDEDVYIVDDFPIDEIADELDFTEDLD